LYNVAKQKFHQKAYTYSMQHLPYYDPLSKYAIDVFKTQMQPEEWAPLYMLVSEETKLTTLFNLSRETN